MPALIKKAFAASLLAVAAFAAAANLSCLLLSNKSIFYLFILWVWIILIDTSRKEITLDAIRIADKDHPITLTDQEVLAAVGENKQEDMPKHSKSGIVVKGLYDVAVHFSKCCSPVPGDEIDRKSTRLNSSHRT